MRIFTILDYLLLPFYVWILFYFLKRYNQKNNHDPILVNYFSLAYKLKIGFAIFYALFAEFLLGGDTEMYFTAGIDFKHIVLDKLDNVKFIFGAAKEFGEFYEANMTKTSNYGYVSAASNLMVIKIVGLFSLISFNSYLIISLFFSLISFIGLWGIFKILYKIYPAYHKIIFFSLFLVPSVLFWGSGILKDTLCIGFLGIGFYSAYNFFFDKIYKIKYFIFFVISFYFLYQTKSYIFYSFFAILALWYFTKVIMNQKSFLSRLTLISVSIIVILIFLSSLNLSEIISNNTADAIAENINNAQDAYKRLAKLAEDDGAIIDYGEITPTLSGIIRVAPKALNATLFRPYVWESKKITSLFAALEGAILFCMTIFVFFRKGILNPFRIIRKDMVIFFLILFSIVFATSIGLNCFNLGTLVRYKIPCLPFYTLSLLLIYKKQNEPKH
jgi:hypothetical protein